MDLSVARHDIHELASRRISTLEKDQDFVGITNFNSCLVTRAKSWTWLVVVTSNNCRWLASTYSKENVFEPTCVVECLVLALIIGSLCMRHVHWAWIASPELSGIHCPCKRARTSSCLHWDVFWRFEHMALDAAHNFIAEVAQNVCTPRPAQNWTC